MLGNFSFGDYFKLDAIKFAWEFVTGAKWLGIDPARLMATVYHTDDEAFEVWHKVVGLPRERIVRIGDKPEGGSDNFWQMGDTGPCGPCTEIFYDHGADVAGGPPGSADADGDRWIEIWNLVFMQFERSSDGALTPLPKPSVDTGMGLERTAAVMQGVHSNYEIDLFKNIIHAAAALAGTTDENSSSLRVIADHIRACTFLIVDGVLPANDGRGYVLRRIIRRAIRHGYKLGITEPFFYKLVGALVKEMGSAYPELVRGHKHAERVLQQEEERFAETLTSGMALLEAAIETLQGKVIDGAVVFKLYDTFGFPADLTADIARERGLGVDESGFEKLMEAQRERARAASRFGAELKKDTTVSGRTVFQGYEGLDGDGQVIALLQDGAPVDVLAAGDAGEVVLDRTPFYAEAGGQVGDAGELTGSNVRFIVADTQKRGVAHSHLGKLVAGRIALGDTLGAHVDGKRRRATALNHTATHLLHAALREVLGTHVQQKGSLVAPDRLRFDFSHFQALKPEEIRAIERRVNAEIRGNVAAETNLMDYEAAVAGGAMALFGEKYDKDVRVLRIGDFSLELCGGTHVERAGDIGFFKIVSEGGIASGVRRIEALTGEAALEFVEESDEILRDVGSLVRGSREDLRDKVRDAVERARTMEREIRTLRDRLASGPGTNLAESAVDVGGVKVVATKVDGADAAALRHVVDQLKTQLRSAVVVLATVENPTKVLLIAGVTADQSARIPAGELVAALARTVGGRGGGRADFAQAGGNNPAALDAALAQVPEFVRARLA
jgi:alanyl-tRNA synthetase